MSSKNLLYIVMGLVGLFCFAGIYDAVLRVKPCLHIDAVQ